MKPTTLIATLSLCGLLPTFADKIPLGIEVKRDLAIDIGEELWEPKTEAIPKSYADEKAIAIKFEGLVNNNGLGLRAKLRIINPTDKPMTFRGFSEVSPIIKIEHWTQGKWVEEKRILKCGTGLRQCTIAPGQSAVFGTRLDGDKLPTRVGIARTDVPRPEGSPQPVIWSEKIER